MSENGSDNVVTFRPPELPAALTDSGTETELRSIVEGLKYTTQLLVALDSRLRRLELAHNKAEREKLKKAAIYNPQGERAN